MRLARKLTGSLVVLLLSAGAAAAQVAWQRGDEGWCQDEWGRRDRDRSCHVRTTTIQAPARLDVDVGRNGGVEVYGSSRTDVEIRAKTWADARSRGAAEELLEAIVIEVEDGRISADGPRTGRGESWGVSFEIYVPTDTDLEIRTVNGSIGVEDVRGDIGFSARNGGVHLSGVGGDVRGRTTNGGLDIELDGESWDGTGLDVETTNGGIDLYVPEGFDADLETGTVNGGIDIDFPITVQGRLGRRLRTTLGDGGPTVRAFTTNGGVSIRRLRAR